MSENPELEGDEEQVNLDPDPAPEDGLGEGDFAPFDHTDSYTDVDPNYVPIVDPGGEPDDGDEDLTDEEAEPPEEEDELVPYWATYEMQGRNLDEGTAWQNLATEPFSGELDVEVEGLTAGARWEFRLRLVDRNGQRSRWSEPLQISLPTDFTPPPAPTAPSVDENTGYITSWWDGELTGEMPKDFSHIVKYLQQMHPDGDPDGEPGDPYRFSTMSSAGAFSVGFLLADVQYRTWFTAVDTTGNESPWSDVVEFTPSQAFNTDELEAELEELNTKTLPELEQSLTAKANEATQAVQDFRTEWDENWDPEAISGLVERADGLESEIQRGLAEADVQVQRLAVSGSSGNLFTDPEFETFPDEDDYWFLLGHDGEWIVRPIGSDEPALSMNIPSEGTGSTARAEFFPLGDRGIPAEGGQEFVFRCEMHPTSGDNAQRVVLRFRDGDGRLGNIIYSVNGGWTRNGFRHWYEVRGVAPEGQSFLSVDFQLSSNASGGWANFLNPSIVRQIDGKAVIDGTLLARHVDMEDFTASQGFIDNAFVNLIQGKQADFESAFIDSFIAESATVARQIVASRNLYNDPNLERTDLYTGWEMVHDGIRKDGTGSQSGSYADAEDMLIPAQPGERFEVTVQANFSGSGSAVVCTRSADSNGNYIGGTARGGVSVSSTGTHRGTFEASEDAAYVYIGFYTQSSMGPSDAVRFTHVRVESALDGRMVIDGLLQATTGQLQELFFDTAVGNAISLGVADIIQINADRINSNSWSGQVMTGPVMQSHTANNTGWRIEPGLGLRMWDNSGTQTIRLDGADNYFAGRLHAGIDENLGIELDHGLIEVDDDRAEDLGYEGDELEDVYLLPTPFMRFHTNHNHRQVPRMWVGARGNLNLNPGRVGSESQVATPFRIWGRAEANQMMAASFLVKTNADHQTGGLIREGARTQLAGRAPGYSLPRQMFTTGNLGPYRPSSGAYRGSMTWSTPSVAGSRAPHLSSFMSTVSIDDWRSAVATAGDRTSSGFRFTLLTPGYSGVQAWLYYNAVWE